MRPVKKHILFDECRQPVAVQIAYADWLEIEGMLESAAEARPAPDLSPFQGTLTLTEDPLAYQQRMRNEWQ